MRGTRELFPSSDAGFETPLNIAWLFTPEEWDSHFGPGRPRALPYLPSRAALDRNERGEPIQFGVVDLLCGVLYCWSSLIDPRRCDDPGVRREFLKRLLQRSQSDFGWPTLERLVLEAAAERAKDYGSQASVPMLLAGLDICSESVPIRSDLIVELWLLLTESDEADLEVVCRSMVKAYEGIGLESLRTMEASFAEQAVYLYGAALHLLGRRDAFKRHFRKAAQPIVEHPTLMNRLWRIARGEPLGFAELQVFNPRRLADPSKVPAEEIQEQT